MQHELTPRSARPSLGLPPVSVPDAFVTVCAAHGWMRRGGEIEISLAGGRTQRVTLESFTDGGQDRVRITTGVGDASMLTPSRLYSAMRVNRGLAHGALAIRDGKLVLTDTFPSRDATPHHVEQALFFLARTADLYERVLFGTDEH